MEKRCMLFKNKSNELVFDGSDENISKEFKKENWIWNDSVQRYESNNFSVIYLSENAEY